MIPTDMNLKIRSRTAGYNNKILVSDGKFNLGKNDEVNLAVPAMKNHKVTQTAARPKHNSNDVISHVPNISHKPQEPKTITHNDEKLHWYRLWQVVLHYGIYFDKHYKFKYINSKYIN